DSGERRPGRDSGREYGDDRRASSRRPGSSSRGPRPATGSFRGGSGRSGGTDRPQRPYRRDDTDGPAGNRRRDWDRDGERGYQRRPRADGPPDRSGAERTGRQGYGGGPERRGGRYGDRASGYRADGAPRRDWDRDGERGYQRRPRADGPPDRSGAERTG